MNILVMGAGAIGSICGGLLAKAGHEVHLVGREPHMSAIRQLGLAIQGIWGEHRIGPLVASTKVDELPPLPYDLVIISTKAYDTERALSLALPAVGDKTLVLSAQNGLGNVEAIASLVGQERTLGGRVMFGAELIAPGRVEVTVLGGELMLGSPTRSVPLDRVEALASAFNEAGIASLATEDILSFIWAKLLYNCCLNPLSALLGVSYGLLGSSASCRDIMAKVIEEILAVAAGVGIGLSWGKAEDYYQVLLGELIPRTAAHYASMYTDLRRGKRTEIDALNGAICRLGERLGVPTPVNGYLTWMVKAKEELNRSPEQSGMSLSH